MVTGWPYGVRPELDLFRLKFQCHHLGDDFGEGI